MCVWCRPSFYCALAVGPCPRVLVGMWHFGRLVCWIFFRCSSVIWSSVPFSCHFWGANVSSVKSLGVWDSNIAATRQQTKERLEKYRDIFDTQCYCVVACFYFVFFIFELQLWKKLVFYHLLRCCFTICVASDKFCICLAWNCIDWQLKFVGPLLRGWFAYYERADYFHSSLSDRCDNALHLDLSCFNLGTYSSG